jgi:hypothetical protein
VRVRRASRRKRAVVDAGDANADGNGELIDLTLHLKLVQDYALEVALGLAVAIERGTARPPHQKGGGRRDEGRDRRQSAGFFCMVLEASINDDDND